MELVQKIEKNNLLASDWGIYKLNEEEIKKYGGNFALSQGIFSDYAIEHMGIDELLSGLKDYRYEGFFETQREAYMQVKLVEMTCKIERMEYALKDFVNATKDLDGVYVEGNKNAPIKIVEYADLQCPACRMYYNSSKNFLKKYSDKILFVYKHFPLDGQCNSMIKKDYHKYACFASLFSLCAGEQGKYWESMDEIYTMSALSEDKGDLQVKKEFEEIIDDLGLDKIAFNECLESRRYINKIITDIEEAKSLNIPGTPFVFINGKQLKNRNEIIMEEIFNYILSNN